MLHRRFRSSLVICTFVAVVAVGSADAQMDVVIAECPAVGLGGDNALIRGIRFTVDQSFSAVEVRMAASATGVYNVTAELRRSMGFVAPLAASVTVSATIVSTSTPVPYPTVRFDFPQQVVTGSDTFTLKFTGASSVASLFFEVAGIGNFPCMDIVATNENNVASPTLRTSPTGLRVIAQATAVEFIRGDASDSGSVNLQDGVWMLNALFVGGPQIDCFGANDANDDGSFNLVDPITLLNALFVAGSPLPPAPYPMCGDTGNPSDCVSFASCP